MVGEKKTKVFVFVGALVFVQRGVAGISNFVGAQLPRNNAPAITTCPLK